MKARADLVCYIDFSVVLARHLDLLSCVRVCVCEWKTALTLSTPWIFSVVLARYWASQLFYNTKNIQNRGQPRLRAPHFRTTVWWGAWLYSVDFNDHCNEHAPRQTPHAKKQTNPPCNRRPTTMTCYEELRFIQPSFPHTPRLASGHRRTVMRSWQHTS